MPEPPIEPDCIALAVLDADPEIVAVFLGLWMRYPGCVMATFTTLAQAAASPDLDAAEPAAELRAVLFVDRPGAHR